MRIHLYDSNGAPKGYAASITNIGTNYSGPVISANGSSVGDSTVIFSNSNNVSFGMNGSTVTATADPYLMALQAGLTILAAGTAYLANSNGISFGITSNSVTASHNGLTTAMGSDAGSNFVAATAAFAGTNASGTIASNGISISVNAGGGGGTVSAGTTNVALGGLSFANGNGVSFGLNGSTITATVQTNYLTTAALSGDTSKYVQAWHLTGNTAGTTSSLQGTKLYFEGGNSLTVSGSSNTIVFSVGNYLTTAMASNRGSDFVAANAAFAGTNCSGTVSSNGISVNVPAAVAIQVEEGAPQTSGTVQFLDSNGISWGLNAGSLTASHNGLTTAMQSNASKSYYAVGNTTQSTSFATGIQAISFRGEGVASVGMSNGSVVISVPSGGGGLTNINISAGTTSNNASNFTFANGNGVTFGLNAGTITASHNGLTTARASNDAIGLNTAKTNVTWTVNSDGISLNAGGYAGTTSGFAGANISGSITHNTDGINLSLSVAAPGGGTTLSGYNPFSQASTAIQQHSNGTLMFWPLDLPAAVQYDRLGMYLYNTNSSNSSGSHTLSFWWGVYSRNGASLSLHHSGSGSTAITHSGTAGSYSLFSNIRIHTIAGPTTTMNAGNYWIGFISRTTSGGANGSYSMACLSQVNSGVVGVFGAAPNNTAQPALGMGAYSASTSGIPGSVAFTEITGTAANYRRFPQLWFASSTQ